VNHIEQKYGSPLQRLQQDPSFATRHVHGPNCDHSHDHGHSHGHAGAEDTHDIPADQIFPVGHDHSSPSSVIREMDQISNILCNVVDAAEFVRNAHPSREYQEAAHEAHGMIANFMQYLNTNKIFSKVLEDLIARDQVSKILTDEELAVAKLFLYDFVASGHETKRDQFVRLSEQIHQLGYNFIRNTSEETKLTFSSREEVNSLPVYLQSL